jgi:hypothetical protein
MEIMKSKVLYKLIGIFSFFIVLGCNPSKRNWEKAVNKNSASGYHEYLMKYPESEKAQTAMCRYDSLDWVETSIGIDSNKAVNYLVNHPEGKYVRNARLALDSIEWSGAISEKDTNRMSSLLKKFNIHRINGLRTYQQENSSAHGHFKYWIVTRDDVFCWGGDPVEAVFYRDVVGWRKGQIDTMDLQPGLLKIFYVDSVIYQQKIDPSITDKELCDIFGVPYNEIY